MAYCRHTSDSDVYLFLGSKYEAHASRSISGKSVSDAFRVDIPEQALEGLLRFRRDGFTVLEYAIERLQAEIRGQRIRAEAYDPLDHIAEPLRSMFMNYLEVTDVSQICQTHSVFGDEVPDEDDELTIIPKGFKHELEMDNVSTPGFSIGYLTFGIYNGKKVIIEQIASPLSVYWKK